METQFKWFICEDEEEPSDTVGIPWECHVDDYRLFADDGLWTATNMRTFREEAYGPGRRSAAEDWYSSGPGRACKA